MIAMLVNHDVEDYDQWKAAYDAFPKHEMGVRAASVARNLDDPDNISVYHAFDTAEAARDFASHADLKEAMEAAGVKGMPRIEIFDEVESLTY